MEFSNWGMIVLLALIQLTGLVFAVSAILHSRTPEASIAWAICLVLVPGLSLPLYAIFGPRTFWKYRQLMSSADSDLQLRFEAEVTTCEDFTTELPDPLRDDQKLFETLAAWPFTYGNSFDLLHSGETTFTSIFEAIDKAAQYVLVQFYIVRNDFLGLKLKQKLIAAKQRGVKVYFLLDQVGSWALNAEYIEELRSAGVSIQMFSTSTRSWNRLQLNFRNHRKLVLVDGELAFTGGCNVGVEYLGQDPRYGPWRDTSVRLSGPIVQGLQRTFVRDWYWATEDILTLNWSAKPSEDANVTAIPISTGAADAQESCSLIFLELIQLAQKRLWIASPYTVPDPGILNALQLAALRGVDVRILAPRNCDHFLVNIASLEYQRKLIAAGVKVYHYLTGFMHQKVMVADECWGTVGTANLDNRSMRLNFELITLAYDKEAASAIANMLEVDLAQSEELNEEYFERQSSLKHFTGKLCRLFAPIL